MVTCSEERRTLVRARLEKPLWLNKYIEGFPHLSQLLEVSESGLLLRTIHEPETREATFPLELEIPGSAHRLWLWAKNVRRTGTIQAVEIGYADLLERAQLRQLVRWSAA